MTPPSQTSQSPQQKPGSASRKLSTLRSLRGKVALVTGGGSGLGAALSHALAASGAQVIVADINEVSAHRIVAELPSESSSAPHMPITFDVGNADAAANAVSQIVDQCGGLDILINNAGTDKTAPVEDLSIDEFDRVLSTNLRGPFLLSRLVLPVLRQRGRGDIVNIASTAARRAWPNASAYHASKWGLLGLSHALHAELRRDHIRVTAVIVGGMRTPFLLDRFTDLDPNRLQDPANVAAAVVLALQMPDESVIPEIMVLPYEESSWP